MVAFHNGHINGPTPHNGHFQRSDISPHKTHPSGMSYVISYISWASPQMPMEMEIMLFSMPQIMPPIWGAIMPVLCS